MTSLVQSAIDALVATSTENAFRGMGGYPMGKVSLTWVGWGGEYHELCDIGAPVPQSS